MANSIKMHGTTKQVNPLEIKMKLETNALPDWHKNRFCQGFTLIEIAIVVVIIGLLAGGVLKGLEILEDTRIQKTSEQIRSLQSAWFGYINRYQQIPGDDNQAQTFLGNNATNGNGDGILSSTAEQSNAWQHLHLSGILQGHGTHPTTTPWGNPFDFSYNRSTKEHLLCIKNLSKQRSAILDKKIDDGVANAGAFFGLSASGTNYNTNDATPFCTRL